jgi:hypothetical protein
MKQVIGIILFLFTIVLSNGAFCQLRPWLNQVDLNLHVLSPSPDQNTSSKEYLITPDNKISITIKFNWPVKPATVVVGSTLILDFPKNHNVKASHSWSDNKTLTITTFQTRSELLPLPPDKYFSMKLIGTKTAVLVVNGIPLSTPIQATNGHYLDGDYDGKDGGNFVISFVK